MNWPDERPAVLIAAISGRALAGAARRAGYVPLVADLFADLDTRALAGAHARLAGPLARGLRRRPLMQALDGLARGRAPVDLVYGSGFEDRPSLLDAVAARHRLLGNAAETVRRLKDPFAFAELCQAAEVPHPPVRRDAAPDRTWLEKRAGAAGGRHVRAARPGVAPRKGRYLQRRVPGRPVSALFAADGRRALVLGFSEQWADPAPRHPFRYAGAVRPAAITASQTDAMTQAVARLAPAAGLVGLNSADFLLRPDGFDLLEINPRPGASLDVFGDAGGSVFRLHVAGCEGRLPDAAPEFPGAAAARIVYARRTLSLRAGFAWPDWAADRQPPGAPVAAGGPLCTVLACAETAPEARALVEQRAASILALAEGQT